MNTDSTLELLRKYESRNVTFMEADGSWPIVWERAKGVHVWDEKGKRYLDMTAAFGVAAAGHANPRVIAAGQKQMGRLLHAMGDVHPHRLKAQLARELSRLTFERWTAGGVKPRAPALTGKTIFCNSGFEAVEAALKTATLATHNPGVIAFENAYHGLGYGALNATHRAHFRARFERQLGNFAKFAPFPSLPDTSPERVLESRTSLREVEEQVRKQMRAGSIGAVLVEPIQVRGGIHVPPVEFLPLLRRMCDEYEALLVLDEIYTGFGRTGRWFACEHGRVVPDLICVGKALTGGFPLSACIGRSELMDSAWPSSSGEAIHTSTFLGHPVGCAMALAQIREIEQRDLPARSGELGAFLLQQLHRFANTELPVQLHVRGLGLLTGLELVLPNGQPATQQAVGVIKLLLQRGFVFLPEGEHANIISFTPPLTVQKKQLSAAVDALQQALCGVCA